MYKKIFMHKSVGWVSALPLGTTPRLSIYSITYDAVFVNTFYVKSM